MISWYMLSNDGKLTILVALDQPMAIHGKDMFVLKAIANRSAFCFWIVCCQSRDKMSEMYTSIDTSRSIAPRLEAAVSGWSVRQNSPNPWTDKTTIVSKSTKQVSPIIRLMDATGALIFKVIQKVNVGENQLEIKADVLNGKTGVILWNQDGQWSCQW